MGGSGYFAQWIVWSIYVWGVETESTSLRILDFGFWIFDLSVISAQLNELRTTQ